MSSSNPPEIGQWHPLLFVQEGGRFRGSIDGRYAFDAVDDPEAYAGSVLNRGGAGIRLMHGIKMVFRKMEIWNRPLFQEIGPGKK
jgi:hypothetical protein